MTVQRAAGSEPGRSLEHAVMTSCDREPIHRPDAIQPYGLLLVADSASLTVIGGAGDLEGRLTPDWLGRSLSAILEIPTDRFQDEKRPSLSDLRIPGLKGETFSVLRHDQGAHILVELEPIEPHKLRKRPRIAQLTAASAVMSVIQRPVRLSPIAGRFRFFLT